MSAPPTDSFHRKIDYLRLSITDRCNLRCTYDATGHYARPDLLSLMVNLQHYRVTRPMQVGWPAVDSGATDESSVPQYLLSQVTQLMDAIRNQSTPGDVERIAGIVKTEVDTL